MNFNIKNKDTQSLILVYVLLIATLSIIMFLVPSLNNPFVILLDLIVIGIIAGYLFGEEVRLSMLSLVLLGEVITLIAAIYLINFAPEYTEMFQNTLHVNYGAQIIILVLLEVFAFVPITVFVLLMWIPAYGGDSLRKRLNQSNKESAVTS